MTPSLRQRVGTAALRLEILADRLNRLSRSTEAYPPLSREQAESWDIEIRAASQLLKELHPLVEDFILGRKIAA